MIRYAGADMPLFCCYSGVRYARYAVICWLYAIYALRPFAFSLSMPPVFLTLPRYIITPLLLWRDDAAKPPYADSFAFSTCLILSLTLSHCCLPPYCSIHDAASSYYYAISPLRWRCRRHALPRRRRLITLRHYLFSLRMLLPRRACFR